MSGIITPSGLVNELTVITDGDTISEVNVPGEVINRKIKKSVDRTYFQGTLPGRVAVNEADITSLEGLRDGTEQLNPRSFTSGRFDSQELVSGTLSVSGWYTIAETEGLGYAESSIGEISVMSYAGRGASIRYGLRPTGSVRTKANSFIEIVAYAGTIVALADDVVGFRLAKSDTVETSGFKVQMKIASADQYTIQITKNIARATDVGAFLVTPYLDNTPTLPDGVTAGTFLEAGEELNLGGQNIHPLFAGLKVSDDIMTFSFIFPEIVKQGTGISFSDISKIRLSQGSTIVTLSGAATVSNYANTGNNISFRLNEVGVFAGFALNTFTAFRLIQDGIIATIT